MTCEFAIIPSCRRLTKRNSAPRVEADRIVELTEPTENTTAHVLHESHIIDVDDFETVADKPKSPCNGIVVSIPTGMNPHEAYPFSLHYHLGDPWDYSVSQGILTLRARTCLRMLCESKGKCRACDELVNDSCLQGILHRLDTDTDNNDFLEVSMHQNDNDMILQSSPEKRAIINDSEGSEEEELVNSDVDVETETADFSTTPAINPDVSTLL